jgi:hypothetical protein
MGWVRRGGQARQSGKPCGQGWWSRPNSVQCAVQCAGSYGRAEQRPSRYLAKACTRHKTRRVAGEALIGAWRWWQRRRRAEDGAAVGGTDGYSGNGAECRMQNAERRMQNECRIGIRIRIRIRTRIRRGTTRAPALVLVLISRSLGLYLCAMLPLHRSIIDASMHRFIGRVLPSDGPPARSPALDFSRFHLPLPMTKSKYHPLPLPLRRTATSTIHLVQSTKSCTRSLIL